MLTITPLSFPFISIAPHSPRYQCGNGDFLRANFAVGSNAVIVPFTKVLSGGQIACSTTDFFTFTNLPADENAVPVSPTDVNIDFYSKCNYANNAAVISIVLETHDIPRNPASVIPPTTWMDRYVGERMLYPLAPQDRPVTLASRVSFFCSIDACFFQSPIAILAYT
jgi:hypothetical protein